MQSCGESEGDADHGEEAESPNNVEDSLEYAERSSEDDLQSETSVSPTSDSPSSSSAAANDGQPKRSSKQKGKSTSLRTARLQSLKRSSPDRLEIFGNDWDDLDDHMETRL